MKQNEREMMKKMAEEFEIKPDKEQEKREQAKRDLAELQNLLEPEEDDDE